MASASGDIFCIALEGAEPEALRRGLAAAHAVFDQPEVEPQATFFLSSPSATAGSTVRNRYLPCPSLPFG